jgi:RNA polymerase sigma-70 factor (ECF subfamily)
MPAGSPPVDPDVALMLRVQQGDRPAFSELLERNHRRVLNLAYRYLKDRSLAEDVVQETFLKIYKARDRYRPDAKFSSYMLRIASNICLSRLRRKQPLRLGGESDEGSIEHVDTGGVKPGEAMLSGELEERVRAAVDALPDRQRMAILLNKFEGLDYSEVAKQLGLSASATKSLLHRARMTLKDLLSNYLDRSSE